MGNYPLACFLAKNGVDINAKDELYGEKPLHHAARTLESSDSKIRIMDLLPRNGANIGELDKYWNTPLHYASEYNIAALLKKRANTKASDGSGYTLLHYAVRAADGCQIIKLLLNNGANIEARNPHNWCTPLHDAITRGDQSLLEVITLLLDRGANIEASTTKGYTLLAIAIGRRLEDASLISLVTLLLDREANINALSEDGTTPLLIAMTRPAKKRIIPQLLERGANIEARNKKGQAALHIVLACEKLDLGLVNLLLDRGANIEAQDEEGNTALHIAVKKGVEAIRLLLVRGAWKCINVSSYVKGCETVLDRAAHYCVSLDIKILLKESGAKLSRKQI